MKKRMHSQNETFRRFPDTFNTIIRFGIMAAVVILFTVDHVSAGQKSQIEKIPCVTVVSGNGETYSGRVFEISDTSVTLWCSEELHNEQNYDQHSTKRHYSEIDYILIERKSNILSGVAIGTLFGTTLGLFSSQLVPVTWTDVDWSPFEMAETMLEIPLVLTGAVLGGVAGALQGIDTKIPINGDIESFQDAIPILQELKIQ